VSALFKDERFVKRRHSAITPEQLESIVRRLALIESLVASGPIGKRDD